MPPTETTSAENPWVGVGSSHFLGTIWRNSPLEEWDLTIESQKRFWLYDLISRKKPMGQLIVWLLQPVDQRRTLIRPGPTVVSSQRQLLFGSWALDSQCRVDVSPFKRSVLSSSSHTVWRTDSSEYDNISQLISHDSWHIGSLMIRSSWIPSQKIHAISSEIHFGWGGMGETRAQPFMVMSDQSLAKNCILKKQPWARRYGSLVARIVHLRFYTCIYI